eukprot:651364-Pleurochrysis_carterae.AAC.2
MLPQPDSCQLREEKERMRRSAREGAGQLAEQASKRTCRRDDAGRTGQVRSTLHAAARAMRTAR